MSVRLDLSARLRMLAVASGGLGYMRPFPGTWGSLPPVVVAFGLIPLGVPPWLFALVMLGGMIVFTGFSIAFGDEAEARFRKKDPSQVVADETAGQCVALLAFPMSHAWWPALLLIAFLSFRLFDIVKPSPARDLQHVPGGWGIVLDDLVAGAMALAVVQLTALALG